MALKVLRNLTLAKSVNFATPCRFVATATVVPNSTNLSFGRHSCVINNICDEISDLKKRLFAVVYIHGKQFKVSQDDIIQLEGNIAVDVGERLKLEKVLMIGGENFSVFGRPLIDCRFADVTATVIEKTTTSPEVKYNCVTDDVNHVQWLSAELTALRINRITLDKSVFSE